MSRKTMENYFEMLKCSLCILADPYQGEFPETIEEYLHHGTMKCIAFNHKGTLLAGNYRSLF
jgi:hypothetical protein